MRIPSGDLSPARNRRYGASYGRRRRRTTRAVVLVLLVAVGAGAAYVLRRDDSGAPARAASTPCPSVTATPAPTRTAAPVTALPRPEQVRLVLLNGTPRNGLAMNVGNQLAARGFTITQAANAPAALAGPSTVTYGPGALPAATLVSRTVRGSTLVSAPRAARGSVQVVLGGDFRHLATPAEIVAAGRVIPAPSTSATPAPTGSVCR